MRKLKRLVNKIDQIIRVKPIFDDADIHNIALWYRDLSPNRFAANFHYVWPRPAELYINDRMHEIKMNFCINPFCAWFGLPQERFVTVKNKPYRYKLYGGKEDKCIMCNDDVLAQSLKPALACLTTVYSNWSIAEEIARLIRAESVVDWEKEYTFHKEGCPIPLATPMNNPAFFVKWGENKAKCQRWRCKKCEKLTNVLPTANRRTNFDQKKNKILLPFANEIIGRTPVTRTIAARRIGKKTYYHKLEWIYKRCLEFLERHEKKSFAKLAFERLYVNTDSLMYHLNPLRNYVRKAYKDEQEKERYSRAFSQTHILASADRTTRYVFRADVEYDWTVTPDDLETDTRLYNDDHLPNFARKNDRFRDAKYLPQPPSKHDNETYGDYSKKRRHLFLMMNGPIKGLHTSATYTVIAHLWLLKRMVRCRKWRFVTDDDMSLKTAIIAIRHYTG